MKVLATYSIKGGVGKTTTAVNLAHEAARGGARVLLWDLDPQGSATYLVRVKPRLRGGSRRLVADGHLADHVRGSDVPGVDVAPADFSLRNLDLHLDGTKRPTRRLRDLLEPLAGRYDLFCEVVCEDNEHLLRVLTERFAGIEGIRSTETLVELRFVKESYQWGAR